MDFEQLVVLPQLLSTVEVDSMLLEICLTFFFVELESTHEYKVYLFRYLYKVLRRIILCPHPRHHPFKRRPVAAHGVGDERRVAAEQQLAGAVPKEPGCVHS
ncbi:hypothetical protein [Spiribacter salinus]|uniref:hypothetical protein n=1 Tax=Spiribacter salinus TaxID=1335746 RepID=UPI001C9379DC|nr:hypothetical protein [Spiribacter salinus]